MRRDYSQSTVAQLYETIYSIQADSQWGIIDYFTDLWMDIPQMSDVAAYQRAVLNKYNVAESDLDCILQTVEAVDTSYQRLLIECANAVAEFAECVKNVAVLINPAVISCDPERFLALGRANQSNYHSTSVSVNQTVESILGGIDQLLDEQSPWYEKLANAVGGTAIAVVESAVIGPIAELFGLVDDLIGTDTKNTILFWQQQSKRFILDNWVTNEQWFFGGKAVGDAAAVVGGIAVAATGILTIVNSFTLEVGGTAVSATGFGAIVGVPAIAVSWVGVVEGTAMVSGGLMMAATGSGNAVGDLTASRAAAERFTPEKSFSGEPEAAPNVRNDSKAHALADRIGGQPQARFSGGTDLREFDVISDKYIAQTKPANFVKNQAWRNQAKATFEACLDTGRTPYFHFDGPPLPGVREALDSYAARYGIQYIFDITPL